MQSIGMRGSVRALVLALLLAFTAGEAIAATSVARSAPTQQDYYTTVDSSVSPAALRKADELRLKTISSIIALLKSKKTKNHSKFELYLRLGELYSERHDFLRDQEFRSYDTRYAKWVEDGKKGKEPKLSSTKSRKELTKAVNVFRDLVREFPKHSRTDAALFSLAKTMGRMGNDNAVMYFEKMIKDHKNSKLIPDAYVAMGEYYFEKNKMDKAIDAYQNVLNYKTHKSYPYAVYKLGWAFYNKSAEDPKVEKKYIGKSVSAFKLVVKLAEANAQRHGIIDIKEEALKDLVMVWAETENVKDAWAYFASINQKKHFYDMLSTLGNTYFENGKHKNAISVYARLLKEAPVREDNPKIHAKLVELYAHVGDLKSLVREIDNMNRLYVRGSPWTIKNAKEKAVLEEGAKTAELYTHRYGALYHQKGQKTKQNVFLAAAEDIYESYLKTFADHKNAYEIEFYLADIQYEFKKYNSATDHFTNVAKKDTEKGKYLKDSAYNAVMAMNKLDQMQKYPELPKPGKAEKPIKLPDVKQKFISVIDNYVGWLPKEKDGHPMKFTVAQIYYDYGHYDEAIKRYAAIAEEIPATVQGKSSIKAILGHYASNKDWGNTITWSRKFNGSKAIASAGHTAMVTDILKAALFSRALELEKDKKYADAAKSFVGFQSEFPKDDNADKALFNATVNYYRVGAVENALAAGKKILDSYPKSKLVDEVLLNSAQTYESLAQFDQASKYYERYALSFPDKKDASGALYNAAVLNKGLHQFEKSVALYERFTKVYPADELVVDANLEIAELKERLKDYKGAMEAYGRYAGKVKGNVDQKLFAEAKVAELTARHVSATEGTAKLEKLHKVLTQKDAPAAYVARSLVANVYFSNLDRDFARFKKIEIDNPKMIEKQVGDKQKALVSMAGKYQKVIELANGEYTVASLYRLGEMHENFSNQLLNVPMGNQTQMEIDALRTELEKLALPLKDEAFKFFETAHRRSAEVLTLSAWTKRAYNKLSEMNSQKYPEVLEKVADAEYMSHKLDIDKSVAALTE